jgi:hypothetical protein
MTKTIAVLGAIFVLSLAAIAWLSPQPDRVTDRAVYEATAAQGIVPDCTDLHCFRALVAWVLGRLPGPSEVRWRAYAVVCNAAAALAVLQFCLTLGMSSRAARMASLLSAFGFGSLYTLHDAFTSDPLMYLLGPLMMDELLRGWLAVAGFTGAIGVFAKEFAAAPLFLYSMCAAWERRWAAALRTLATANAVFILWALFHLTLIIGFNYGYGGTTSTRLLSGAGVVPWFEQQSLRGVLSAMFNEFGALYLLAPAGLLLAPVRLRRLSAAAIPAAIAFCYLQQPDRALWNFHFLVTPLAALMLERAPAMLASATVAVFGIANLRVGAQLTMVPTARFALAVSVVLALAVVVSGLKSGAVRDVDADDLALT